VEKPEYDSLKEWKDNHRDEYKTAKEAKYKYEHEYLIGLTRTNRGFREIEVDKGMIGETRSYNLVKIYDQIYFDYEDGKWVIGEIYYYPLRLAYASTVHKSQGLTLDRVQIDFINQFFGQPSMAYVALSRVRTAEGLRLVGTPKLLEERCNVARKVLRWI
jgi:ATP-dependent exoDNAse (exonuclease V) alpha subunit